MQDLSTTIRSSMTLLATVLALCLPLCAQDSQTKTPSTPQTARPERGDVIGPKSPAALPNYAGTWKLNHEMSQSPSPVFEKTELTLLVKQTADELLVEQKMRLNGHDQPAQPLTFNLSAKVIEVPVSRPAAGLAKLQSRWLAKEQRLELRTTIKTTLRDEKGDKLEDVTLTTIEYWELLDNGKLLKVVRIREWPDRTESSRLMFEK